MMTLNLLSSGGMPMISEFDTIPLEAIALSSTIIRQAIALSQTASNQWQAYLDAIAYLSIEEWLRERLPHFSPQHTLEDITSSNCLQIKDFILYILAITQSSGDRVEVHRNLMNPNLASDLNHNAFIVVVEIQEEIDQAVILGFSHYDQFMEYLHASPCDRYDNTYQVPLSLFEYEPERLLLYLQHLEPVKSPQLNPITELPQVKITELILNTGLWLQDKLDEIAQNLSWHLLPAYAPMMRSSDLRSPKEELETIVSEVERLHVKVPPSAKAAYQDFHLGDRHLRLYATVWADGHLSENSEWSLLLVLGCQAINEIPHGVRMRVRDQQQVLVDRRLEDNSKDPYLYACVTGDQNEFFTVSISLPSGVMLTLPAFAFYPNAL